MLILGILLVIMGVFCYAHPVVLAVTTGVVVGFSILATGINMVSLATYI